MSNVKDLEQEQNKITTQTHKSPQITAAKGGVVNYYAASELAIDEIIQITAAKGGVVNYYAASELATKKHRSFMQATQAIMQATMK